MLLLTNDFALLIAAVIAIKNGKRKLHERLMTGAIALSVAFFGDVCGISHDSVSAVLVMQIIILY
jgi:putative membrane protein